MRNHVWMQYSARVVVRDSYFYGSNGQNLSYGVEPWMTSDLLIENNIFNHLTSPILLGNSQGTVMAYNYMTDIYTTNPVWLYPGLATHDAATGVNLWEGNQGPGAAEDAIHGTHNFETYFRNYLSGRDLAQSMQTVPIILMSYSRYDNLIGNVLGTVGYHTNYQSNQPTNTSCDKSIYNLGWSGTECSVANNAYNNLPIPNDPLVAFTAMRWGNYDTVTGAVRWNAAEVPSGLSQFANPVPADQNLPASFYLSSKPSWFDSIPWPPIGPDVTGGPGPGGHTYDIPAKVCYDNTPKDSSGILLFNANNCYGSGSDTTPPSSPRNLRIR